ncbi:MAG TPA: polyphenol oxidase family protein [Longimicrobiales bacterium]|nr:polyphenol oxidase family protein [Longimicrobiales bacterium]
MSAAPAPRPTPPGGVRRVREEATGTFPLWTHPEWTRRHPWLVQGTTGRAGDGLDMGLFGEVAVATALGRWRALREATGLPTALHARQVHGARVLWHADLPAGLLVADDSDGHATRQAGVLLTVSVADCVPISLVDPVRRAIALLHGGWRGVATGILEAGIAALDGGAGSTARDLELHCGPAICGACYQVGAEVPTALGLDRGPTDRMQLDLRAVIAERGLRAGIPAARITLSAHCTRCAEGAFWSHRAGCRERQLGVLGVRAA